MSILRGLCEGMIYVHGRNLEMLGGCLRQAPARLAFVRPLGGALQEVGRAGQSLASEPTRRAVEAWGERTARGMARAARALGL